MMIGTRNIPGDMLSVPVEDVAVWWREDGDSSSNWSLPRFLKALWLSRIAFNCSPRYLVIFAFVYANSVGAYGSPIQAGEGVLNNDDLHQRFRREEPKYSSLRIIIPVSLGVFLALLIALYFKGKKDTHPRIRAAHGLRESVQAGLAQLHISRTNNRRQSQNASGTGRAGRPQREYSTHSLPAYAKEPGESEQVILHISSRVEIPPADLQLDDVDEEVGTYAENVPESQPPFESMPTNLRESHTADNSSSNPPEHSHRPSRNDTAMRVEAVDNHNSATPDSQGEAPPPYIEAAGSRGD